MNNLDLQGQDQQQGSKAELICQLNCKRIYESRSSGSGANNDVDIYLFAINSNPPPPGIFIPAHKIFLKNCPYFKKILLDLNDGVKVIEVNCDQETLEVIIKFLYIGELELDDDVDGGDKFTKVFRASKEFELPEMTKGCLDFCSRNTHLITEDNWLEIYRYILDIMERSYLTGIFEFLHNDIGHIIVSNSFLLMTFDELKIILEKASDIFNTQHEFLLATYNWLSYDGSELKRNGFTTELANFTWHDAKAQAKTNDNTPTKNKKLKTSHIFDSPSTSQSPSQSKSPTPSTSSPLKNSYKTNVSSTRINQGQGELSQSGMSIKMEVNDNNNIPSTSTSLVIAKTPSNKKTSKKPAGPRGQLKKGSVKVKDKVQKKSIKVNTTMNIAITENVLNLKTQYINEGFPLNFEVIFLVESLIDSEPNSLYCYSPRKQCVSKFADLPINNLRDFSMVTTKDKLYMLGGLIKKTTNYEEDLVRDVYSFDLLLKGQENSSLLWTKENDMILNDAMDMFPTLIDGENIYMVGGFMSKDLGDFCTSFIEKLNLNEKAEGWKMVYSMTYGRERCASTILNNKIYISGGSGNKNCSKVTHILKSFEVFDMEFSTGHNLKQMKEDRLDHNLVAYKNDIYALGGYGRSNRKTQSVEVYDSILNIWEPAPSMNYIRANSASFVFNEGLYVIGGEEADVIMEKLDYENKTWIEVQTPSVQFPENSDFSSSIVLMLPSNESSTSNQTA